MLETFGDIRHSLAHVQQLRSQLHSSVGLAQRHQQLKRWQCARFASTYADLNSNAAERAAIEFFLTELYSSADFSLRDAQFARIASKLEKLFPASVARTATLLAQLHALTESLDVQLAQALRDDAVTDHHYRQAWQALCTTPSYLSARQAQLDAVLALGDKLTTHTRTPGLRMMLKMMRKPAQVAGLNHLQHFLERGFDTFGELGKAGLIPHFLDCIAQRERAWMESLEAS